MKSSDIRTIVRMAIQLRELDEERWEETTIYESEDKEYIEELEVKIEKKVKELKDFLE
jgi:septal ring factor EnvC (AmiA/AmiB activator)